MLLELNQQEAEGMLAGEGHPLHATAVAKLEQAIAIESGPCGEFHAANLLDAPEQQSNGGAS